MSTNADALAALIAADLSTFSAVRRLPVIRGEAGEIRIGRAVGKVNGVDAFPLVLELLPDRLRVTFAALIRIPGSGTAPHVDKADLPLDLAGLDTVSDFVTTYALLLADFLVGNRGAKGRVLSSVLNRTQAAWRRVGGEESFIWEQVGYVLVGAQSLSRNWQADAGSMERLQKEAKAMITVDARRVLVADEHTATSGRNAA